MRQNVQRSLAKVGGHERMTATQIAVDVGITPSHSTQPRIREMIRKLIDEGSPIGSDHSKSKQE